MDSKQFAQLLVKFLGRTSMSPGERGEFNEIEKVIVGLASGMLILGAPQPEKTEIQEPAR